MSRPDSVKWLIEMTHFKLRYRVRVFENESLFFDMKPLFNDMTHWYVWYYAFTCMTWPIHLCDMTHLYVWNDPFICVIWLIHMHDMTHWYVWYDQFTWMTWPIHMRDMTHSYAWHDAFLCVTWLIHMTWLIQTCDILIHMCDIITDSTWD